MKKLFSTIVLSGAVFAATSATAQTTDTDTTTSRTYSEETLSNRYFGGFYIEPGIYGSSQDADVKSSAVGNDATGTSQGFGIDLKLGGHVNDMFFAGADARYERARLEDAAYAGADVDSFNWGPMVGMQAPVFGARVWASYVVDGEYNPEAGARGFDVRFRDPYGWRAGIGARFAMVSVNLEYEDLTYSSTDIQSIGDITGDTGQGLDFSQRGYGLSLSFPMDL